MSPARQLSDAGGHGHSLVRLGVCLVVALLQAGSVRSQPAPANPVRQDLQELGDRLNRQAGLVRRLEHESTSLLQTLEELDRQVELAEAELVQTEQRLAEDERQLSEAREQRQQASQSLVRLRMRLGDRLRQLYMQGQMGWLNLVFGADSISEGIQRNELFKRLALADERLAREVRRSRDLLAETEQRIEEHRTALQQAVAEVARRRTQAAAARDEKRSALDLVEKRSSLRKRALVELKRARTRLGDLVATIEGKPSAAGGFASWRGRLPAPVAGGRVEQRFGRQVDERFGTVTINQGADIRAPLRAPVRSVYPGQVVFAGVLQGYGRMVIVDHGAGYYTLYAHLDSLAVDKGTRVQAGQEVGKLGESGSLKGPFLYFEVRKGGRAVDPGLWVRVAG